VTGTTRANSSTNPTISSSQTTATSSWRKGHNPGAMGNPRVLKFDKNGKFIKSWGGKGKGPGNSMWPTASPSMPRASYG
jgi:hypothetical protein